MKRSLFLLAFLLFAQPAHADSVRYCNLGTLLSAVDMQGVAGTRTISLGPTATCYKQDGTTATGSVVNPGQFKYLVLDVRFTNDSATDLVATHTVGYSAGTAAPGVCSAVVSGSCTWIDGGVFSDTTIAGSSVARTIRAGIRGYPVHSIVFSATGAAGNDDDLTVYGWLVE